MAERARGGVVLTAVGVLLGAWLLAAPLAAQPLEVNVIPKPQSVQAGPGGDVWLRQGARISTSPADPGARAAARWLASLARKSRGLQLSTGVDRAATIELKHTPGPADAEAYGLVIGRGRVIIKASSDAGLFYGVTTLWQLMTAEEGRGPVRLQSLTIDDQPRFAWRGLLLDSARHMQSTAFILSTIDWMALHKLNVLQWHLTDDQGWRLPVDGYPKLASEAAWRVPASLGAPALNPKTGKPIVYGGFYSKAEIREIVAHAKARHVTIVPEVEMPGHALAALLAYPQLSAGPLPPASMKSEWGLIPDAYGVDEPVFAFLDHVLGEVADLFPGRFIDIGGDEVPLDIWKASPAAQARMKALGLADEAALQNYFIRRVDGLLAKRGRRLIGWEEILHGGPLPPDAAISSWLGAASAVSAARSGHDVVLAIAPTLYFDNRQSSLASEPPGRGWVVSLHDVYALDPGSPPAPPPAPGAAPTPAPVLTEADRAHVLGVQGNLWTEHVRTDERAVKMVWPRAAAVAEAGWTPQSERDWGDFLTRMPAEYARFEGLGLAEDRSALGIELDASVAAGQGRVALSSQAHLGEIRYTTDGAAPTRASMAYVDPFTTPLPARVRAAVFLGDRRISDPLDQRLTAVSLDSRMSEQLTLCPGTLPLNLEGQPTADGRRPVFLIQIMNPCWIWPNVDVSGVSSIRLTLAATPFNLELAAQASQVVHRLSASPTGEIQIRQDNCDTGELLAQLPLPAARPETTLEASLPPRSGTHSLCFVYAGGARSDPIWGVDRVELIRSGDHG